MVEIDGHGDHRRHHGEDDEGKPHIHPAEDHKRADDLDGGDEEFLWAVVGKLCDVEKVGGDAGHDLAHLGVVKIIEGKLLQMGEHVRAHIGLDLRAHDVPDRRHKEIGARVHQPQEQVQPADPQHSGHGQCRQVVDAHICYVPYQHGQHQLAHGSERRTEQVEHQHPFILAKIGYEAAQKPLLTRPLLSLSQKYPRPFPLIFLYTKIMP